MQYGEYLYTNNLGYRKRLTITKRKDNKYSWLCFELSRGECCYYKILTEQEHELCFGEMVKSYKDFTKIS